VDVAEDEAKGKPDQGRPTILRRVVGVFPRAQAGLQGVIQERSALVWNAVRDPTTDHHRIKKARPNAFRGA